MSMHFGIIPVYFITEKTVDVKSTNDGDTVINITKPEQAECFICSVSLNSLTRLEKHKEEKHENEELFYCDDCGIPKKTSKELRDHQYSHKTSFCPRCEIKIVIKIEVCEKIFYRQYREVVGADAWLGVGGCCLAVS